MWMLYLIAVSVCINLLVMLAVFIPESKGTSTLSRAWNAFKRQVVQEEK